MEAKLCPDGSYVGRQAPNCEFAKCPENITNTIQGKKVVIQCTEEQKNTNACTKEYMPVCGWFNENIKCIRYPCAATYGNKCEACSNPIVKEYTEGECPTVNDTIK
jgi:hypothetical protein